MTTDIFKISNEDAPMDPLDPQDPFYGFKETLPLLLRPTTSDDEQQFNKDIPRSSIKMDAEMLYDIDSSFTTMKIINIQLEALEKQLMDHATEKEESIIKRAKDTIDTAWDNITICKNIIQSKYQNTTYDENDITMRIEQEQHLIQSQTKTINHTKDTIAIRIGIKKTIDALEKQNLEIEERQKQAISKYIAFTNKTQNDEQAQEILKLHQGTAAGAQLLLKENYSFNASKPLGYIPDNAGNKITYIRTGNKFSYESHINAYGVIDLEGNMLVRNKTGNLQKNEHSLETKELKQKGYQPIFSLISIATLDLTHFPKSKPIVTYEVQVKTERPELKYTGPAQDKVIVQLETSKETWTKKVGKFLGLYGFKKGVPDSDPKQPGSSNATPSKKTNPKIYGISKYIYLMMQMS